jgi:dUTP diphosphatase
MSGTKPSKPPRVPVRVQRLPHAADLALPAYQSAGAAGLDLLAALDLHRPLHLAPGARALVPTGLVLELPPGYEAQVRPRSGWALRSGMTVLNSPGTIDSDYRGEVQVILANLGGAAIEIRRGDRIAQLVVQPVVQALLVEVDAVAPTSRGAGGFGSTGAEAKAAAAGPADRKKAPNASAAAKAAAPRRRSKTKSRT